jgi:hypothetical protein
MPVLRCGIESKDAACTIALARHSCLFSKRSRPQLGGLLSGRYWTLPGVDLGLADPLA